MKIFWIIFISASAFLLLSFLAFLFLIKPEKRRAQTDKFKNLDYAHRGLHGGGRAENSLSAFKAAADAGFAIELDVRLSSDGVLMVFHDDTLDRMTEVTGRVDSVTAKELSALTLGGTEDTIPTFAEVNSVFLLVTRLQALHLHLSNSVPPQKQKSALTPPQTPCSVPHSPRYMLQIYSLYKLPLLLQRNGFQIPCPYLIFLPVPHFYQ